MVQCHQPDMVGASGSKQDTTKDCVCSGKPDQLRAGETLSWMPVKMSGTRPWSVRSAEVRVKEGTEGRKPVGAGGRGRVRSAVIGVPPGR